MSHQTRIVTRTVEVEEEAQLEVCDRCGVAAPLESDGYWRGSAPRDWHVLMTASARLAASRVPAMAMTYRLSFCSVECLAAFAARLGDA